MKIKSFILVFSFLSMTSLFISCASDNTPIVVSGYENTNSQLLQNKKTATPTPTKVQASVSSKTTVSSNSTKTVTPSSSVKPSSLKTELTPSPSPTVDNLSLAQKVLLKSKETYDALNSYSATLTMYTKRNDKDFADSSEVITSESKMIFQQPRNTSILAIKHSISAAAGAKMVWTGGDTVNLKASGILGLLPLSFKLNDKTITTNRGWRLDQMDHVGILSRVLDSKAQQTLAGKSKVNDRDVYVIKVTGNPLDEFVTEEDVYIDMKNFTIVGDQCYSDKELIFQVKLTLEGTNIEIPAGTFEI